MAGVRVELLFVVLAGTLLLVPVRGWEQISETQLHNFYQTGQWSKPHSFTSPDDGRIFGDFDEQIPEDALPDVEGAATSSAFSPFAHHGFQVDTADSVLGDWTSGTGGGFNMPFVRTWSGQSSSELNVVCSEVGFQMNLPTGPLSEVKVLGSKHLLSVTTAPASCGYEVNSFKNTLTVPFTGCNVKVVVSCKTDSYSLQLLYVDNFGETRVATASCDVKKVKSDGKLLPRANDQPTLKCSEPTTAPTTPSKAQNCAVTAGEQVPCGQSGMSSSACKTMGCCMDPSTSACYYPLDECTGDQHFVFAIRYDSASIPVDPTKLVVPGNTNCKPVILNDKVAIFKFKVTECGTHAYTVGETMIYLAEVQSTIQALNLKYGVITRSDPLRFMVECRYGKLGSSQQSLASVGYMVMTPKSVLPSSVLSNGLYAVELRIATDQTYSSYLPTYHQPLRLLLGKPVHLELRLRSPKPDAVILVNYCIAYPRSAKNALVLVYEGCRNPYDPNVSILQISDLPKNRHVRRFVVQAFQFMDQTTNMYLNSEIYFMCSTEVCRTAEKTCQEQCFDGKAP
ncbi:zona pellucida sperm-binding protein 4-like isoform X2 [Morone saxatilis]|uniref:zona pellucida sperm-binding protein 4-like isoform X2 n=1 Tax=Morone saxatilis TaxID=34816 RepID=UPI0015E2539D|nr:zona pellucida sperm-binding protein 4-like isoform X2 [Morone saxatilis]